MVTAQVIRKFATLAVRKGPAGDEIVVNSGQPDRAGDRVFPDGDLSSYRENPVVMWAHDYHNLPVATCSDIQMDADGITASGLQWLQDDPFVARVKNAWDQRVLRAASIGFAPSPDPEDSQRNEFGGVDYHNWTMLEFSIVPIPMDPQALRRLKSLGLTEQRAEWDTAYVNDLPDSAFAAILPGGEKDDEGKTTPRSLRKLPHHKAGGAIDLPHLRNALARVSQADLGSQQSKAEKHLEAHASAEGIGGRSAHVDVTKEMLVRHKEAIKEAVTLVKDAMDTMAEHHKAHTKAHKTYGEALNKAHKALSDIIKDTHPEPDEDDEPGYTGPGDDDEDNKKEAGCKCEGCIKENCACIGKACKAETCECACHNKGKALLSRFMKR